MSALAAMHFLDAFFRTSTFVKHIEDRTEKEHLHPNKVFMVDFALRNLLVFTDSKNVPIFRFGMSQICRNLGLLLCTHLVSRVRASFSISGIWIFQWCLHRSQITDRGLICRCDVYFPTQHVFKMLIVFIGKFTIASRKRWHSLLSPRYVVCAYRCLIEQNLYDA